MAVNDDHSPWLPQPPPPRPARREAAIGAALRRFEGIEDAAPVASERPRRSWANTHRPQLAGVASVLLVAFVGIPVAVIGLRDQTPTSERAPAPSAVQSTPPSSPEVAEAEEPGAGFQPPAAGRGADGESRVAARTDAVPPAPRQAESALAPASPVIAAAAPPPPPPPQRASSPSNEPRAVASAEKVEVEPPGHDVIVTGSRIATPALDAASPTKAIAPQQGYETFLAQLQGAVRANDRGAVIGLIAFPLRVAAAGGTRFYRDVPSVRQDFELIFTPKVRRAILNQSPDRIAVRERVAAIANGRVRIAPACAKSECTPVDPLRIVAVDP